jgi:hypothetical protein
MSDPNYPKSDSTEATFRYAQTYQVVKKRIENSSFCIVAITGKLAAGKTRLSRYLSRMLGIELLEMDSFLRLQESEPSYDYNAMREILDSKKIARQHVILDGVSISPLISSYPKADIFLIYIEKNNYDSSNDDVWFKENRTITHTPKILDVDSQCEMRVSADHIQSAH